MAISVGKDCYSNSVPVQLRQVAEYLSGKDLSDVRVHYHSDKPARLGAAAYAQGSDIFIGPNQQVHLPHELWHVVQQKSGALAGVATQLGDDLVVENALLEKEVDIIGTLITHLIGKLNEHIIYHPTG